MGRELLRFRDGWVPASGLCLMAGRVPGCFGESERTAQASSLPPSQVLSWYHWTVVEGQIFWKVRSFRGTLERARAKMVLIGR